MSSSLICEFFQVKEIKKESSDVFSLWLQNPKKKNLNFKAGQFNMLYVPGVGESAISISGDSKNKKIFQHTIRVVGDVTRSLSMLKKNHWVGLRGPFGESWDLRPAFKKNLIIIAGGIGIAPLRPLILDALKVKSRFKKIYLLYGTREEKDLLFKKDLKLWQKQGIEVLCTVDRVDVVKSAAKRWRGSVGVVSKLLNFVDCDFKEAAAYLCGPDVMMRFTIADLLKLGVPNEKIFVTLERHMKCAVKLCGRCQMREYFLCGHGPVFPYEKVATHMRNKEL